MRPRDEKAIRLVLDGRVTITWRNDEAASGIVDGDTDTYRVSYSPAGRICTCPAGQYRDCSHSLALELAVMKEADELLDAR